MATKIPRKTKAACLRKWREAIQIIRKRRDYGLTLSELVYRQWWKCTGCIQCALCEWTIERSQAPYDGDHCDLCPLGKNKPFESVCHPVWDTMLEVFDNSNATINNRVSTFEHCVPQMLALLRAIPTYARRRKKCSS